MDKKWICVFPTNDGINFANEHFGEADYFDIYSIGREEITFLKRVENLSPEERGHGDPNKAKNIMQTLKKEKVQVMLSLQFGGNIFRMLSHFVCSRVREQHIESMAKKVQDQLHLVEQSWEMGESRKMLQFQE